MPFEMRRVPPQQAFEPAHSEVSTISALDGKGSSDEDGALPAAWEVAHL